MIVIAAIQMCSGSHVEANLALAENLVQQAADAGAKFVVLPENFALMAVSHEQRLSVAEKLGCGPIQTALGDWSRRFGVFLVAGTVPLQGADPNRVRAANLVFNEKGQCVARYDKIHLFDVDLGDQERYRESLAFEPGSEPVTIATSWATVGLSVCYDIRFPELYRRLVGAGAQLFTVPAAFTIPTGEAHWEVLLRARAIENSCYVVAAAQVGHHENGRTTYGHSMIVDPWGKVVSSQVSGCGIVLAPYAPDYLDEVRKRLPSLKHRRI